MFENFYHFFSKALKTMSNKRLGVLIIRNSKNYTTGIITDGQIRRFNKKNLNLNSLYVSEIMTKNPISCLLYTSDAADE